MNQEQLQKLCEGLCRAAFDPQQQALVGNRLRCPECERDGLPGGQCTMWREFELEALVAYNIIKEFK